MSYKMRHWEPNTSASLVGSYLYLTWACLKKFALKSSFNSSLISFFKKWSQFEREKV